MRYIQAVIEDKLTQARREIQQILPTTPFPASRR
jgi:hypothetical protein